MHRALRNVVEAHDGDVQARPEAEIGEAEHDAERTQVVVTDNGGRGVHSITKELADRGGAAFPGRQAIDDRPDRQAESRQDGAEGFGSIAGGRYSTRAADKGDALVPELDQMLSRQGHAEAEVGADVVRALPADPLQHLHDRNAVAFEFVDNVRSGDLGRRKQDAVDAVLAHARDEAVLARRLLRGVGDERHPARLIEDVVDPGGEFRVERIGDLADDEATVWVRRVRKFAAAR